MVRTSVSFSPEDHAELERIASRKKVSIAWVIRDAVEAYIRSERERARQADQL